jgi:hypothetical protein
MAVQDLILAWLEKRLHPEAFVWLRDKAGEFSAGAPEKVIFSSFSAAFKHSGKGPLSLDAAELRAAGEAVEGWNPKDWSLDEAARTCLLLALPAGANTARLLDQMYETADVGEAVTLQKALAVLPGPEGHLARGREAIRSNIKLVFEAVALRNPYPARNFDDTGWNQMVVKTFFIDSPLSEVWGLDKRNNATLRQMLFDLALERWAAGRSFSPMLWRCVGPLADDKALEALKKVFSTGEPAERRAAALALKSCPLPEAARILSSNPALFAGVNGGKVTWENYDRP